MLAKFIVELSLKKIKLAHASQNYFSKKSLLIVNVLVSNVNAKNSILNQK